jgi:exonuclease VII small subunit
MKAVQVSQWYPSPCNKERCDQKHCILEEGQLSFDPGTYIQIKGWNSYKVCDTRLKDNVLRLPKLAFERSMPGALDVRTLVIEQGEAQFFEYATEKFPEVVKSLESGKREIFPDAMDPILKDASELEAMSEGI